MTPTGLPFRPGDRVKLLDSNGLYGRVVELRGPLGPKGAQVYRIRLRRKPPMYVEVLEEQMEAAPPPAPAGPT